MSSLICDTRANGIPKDNTTCVKISALLGFAAAARIASAGIMVIARRATSGTRS
jgi:hypothetical protein